MKFGIIEYGMGNIQSVVNAFEVLDADVVVVQAPSLLRDVDAIILPGVGAFSEGIRNIETSGFSEVLNEQVIVKKKPYLGICLGMQFLADASLEHGNYRGFGWISGTIRRIVPKSAHIRVPHMGWNNVSVCKSNGLYKEIEAEPVFYFVHSYYFDIAEREKEAVTATCLHGHSFPVSVRKNNIFGVQFHPEKSQAGGLMLLKNFIAIVSEEYTYA